jgi:hypothetical protein
MYSLYTKEPHARAHGPSLESGEIFKMSRKRIDGKIESQLINKKESKMNLLKGWLVNVDHRLNMDVICTAVLIG